MQKSLEDLLNTNVEPKALALRREFPDMIRDIVATGTEIVQIRLDARTALLLADDLEFSVQNRDLLDEYRNRKSQN